MNNKTYYYGKHSLDSTDVNQVLKSMYSGFLSQGDQLEIFQEKVAQYCGIQYCLAVSNGTAALHLAATALDLKPGDIAWTTPLTFVATANALRYSGAEVDFVDIDPDTFNLSPNFFAKKLETALKENKLPRVVVPVHFAGQSCEMEKLASIAKKYGVKIIEDACHALGGKYQGQKIGNCKFSDVTVFSLHPVKSITAGEGGLILTNDKRLFHKMKQMRSHGLAKNPPLVNGQSEPWRIEMMQEGFNYKITEMQCALGISQMGKLDIFLSKRKKLVEAYRARLKRAGLSFQSEIASSESAYHLMLVQFDFKYLGVSRRALFDRLKEKNIHLAIHYLPVHMHQFYLNIKNRDGCFPHAETYYSSTFSFPLYSDLEVDDVDYICSVLLDFLDGKG